MNKSLEDDYVNEIIIAPILPMLLDDCDSNQTDDMGI